VRTRRGLALTVLIGAAALAVAAFPFRATWWGGWILATAEAGVVGGLADWFAVTALFRRPLGLPIPHTALIPSNWELLASRVGAMVGGRVLTREYLGQELARLDVADLIARAADRVRRADVERAARDLLGWLAREVAPGSAGEAFARAQRLLVRQPAAPVLAAVLEAAREHGWDQRAMAAAARTIAEALENPGPRRALGGLVDELLARYRERAPLYPRLALAFADLLGVIDRDRVVAALRAGLADVAGNPDHPLRRHLAEEIAILAGRLRGDPALAARLEAVKEDLLGSPVVARLAEEAVAAVRAALAADLARADSDVVAWVAGRVDRWRNALVADAALRRDLDRWVKAQAGALLERHHGRIAAFIEQGVHALGPEGAVRLIEEHAGDDLQYIRVNGTLVGGLAGAGLYAIHLLARLL
jgi:uncharacterized membrane-anchored protein YjiN (DUF445 family)